MLAAPSGAAGFLARHHTAALSAVALVAGMATAIAAVSAWFQQVSPLDVAAFAVAAVLVAAVAYWHTRHAVMALLVALTPLPGLIWAAPLSGGSHFALVPFAAYGFAVALAALYAQHVLDRVVREADGEAPWRSAMAMLVLAASIAAVWFGKAGRGDATLQAVGDTIAAVAAVLLLFPLTAMLLHFDETFIAAANRARERRGRLTERLGGAAVPRWGLSLTGIVMIFLALGWFDFPHSLAEDWWRVVATVVLMVTVLSVSGGGWREGIGLGLVVAATGMVLLWWQSYDTRLVFAAGEAGALAALAGLTGLTAARHMLLWRRAGDAPDVVRRRALEDCSGAVFSVVAATAAIVPGTIHPGAAILVMAAPLAGLSGALLFPAVLTAVETLLPRRRTVEDVFGLKLRR